MISSGAERRPQIREELTVQQPPTYVQRAPYTPEQIKAKLVTDQLWLERAVLAIYKRQTSAEQQSEATQLRNCVGFNAFDAQLASYLAKWLLAGRRLSGKWLERARRMMPKYAGQLADIANSRAA